MSREVDASTPLITLAYYSGYQKPARRKPVLPLESLHSKVCVCGWEQNESRDARSGERGHVSPTATEGLQLKAKSSFFAAPTSWRHRTFEDTDILPSVDLLENSQLIPGRPQPRPPATLSQVGHRHGHVGFLCLFLRLQVTLIRKERKGLKKTSWISKHIYPKWGDLFFGVSPGSLRGNGGERSSSLVVEVRTGLTQGPSHRLEARCPGCDGREVRVVFSSASGGSRILQLYVGYMRPPNPSYVTFNHNVNLDSAR